MQDWQVVSLGFGAPFAEQQNIHAIGDRANHVVLDAMGAALEGTPAGRRFRLEHAQIMRMEDLRRAADLSSELTSRNIARAEPVGSHR